MKVYPIASVENRNYGRAKNVRQNDKTVLFNKNTNNEVSFKGGLTKALMFAYALPSFVIAGVIRGAVELVDAVSEYDNDKKDN